MTDIEVEEIFQGYLHNFGQQNPIPIWTVALCGAISKNNDPGTPTPELNKCCPICLALTPHEVVIECKVPKDNNNSPPQGMPEICIYA